MAHTNIPEHKVVVELLPWYVKGILSPAERMDVDQHLSACPQCQQEIVLYQQLEKANKNRRPATEAWQPKPAQFAHIMQGIDEVENKAATTTIRTKSPGLASKLSAWVKTIPAPVFWFMSLETAAIMALVLILVGQMPAQWGANSFETLSNGEPVTSKALPHLRIVFEDDITEGELRALLQAQQGQIVQGPSILGVYTVQLAKDDANELQQAINNFRANPKVKLAESIDNMDRP